MKLKVEPWIEAGAVGIEAEQFTVFGDWVSVLDSSEIGTFPNYETTYEVTPVGTSTRYRYRWETGAGQFTPWLAPSLINTLTDSQTERVTQAVIQKAGRLMKFPEAPFGHSGVSDWGPARVLADNQIEELLMGLRFQEWDILYEDLAITPEDVIRVCFKSNEDDYQGDTDDIQRAIDSAISWVGTLLDPEGVGLV